MHAFFFLDNNFFSVSRGSVLSQLKFGYIDTGYNFHNEKRMMIECSRGKLS